MLTQKQKDLLVFIHERLQKGDIVPSFEEMKEHLGLKSKSGIHRLITALVERGFLERLPHRARALEVKKLPEGYGLNAPAVPQNIIQIEPKRQERATQQEYDRNIASIPLCGKIAAGSPIEAIQHDGDMVDVPAFLLGNAEYYALTVEGDSMINAGIHDDDVVIIEKTNTARNGDIIVALIDGEEVTLKRLKRDGNTVILIPENPQHEIRAFDAHRVQVQGKLASLFRTYH
jgi:repressor LexA